MENKVYEKITDLLEQNYDLNKADITPESTLADLGLSSLEFAELVMDLEDALGITIELKSGITTVGALTEYVEGLM